MKQLSKLKLNEFVEMNDKELRFIVGGSGTSGSSGSGPGNHDQLSACKTLSEGAKCQYKNGLNAPLRYCYCHKEAVGLSCNSGCSDTPPST
jgi:natural product precursor